MPTPDGKPTDSGRLLRSDDGGDNWQLVSSRSPASRAGRTTTSAWASRRTTRTRRTSSPSNWRRRSTAARRSSIRRHGRRRGGDHHDIWIDPTNGDRMVVSHDGGVSVSINRGEVVAFRCSCRIAQMYHVDVDNQSVQRLRQPAGRSVDARCRATARIGRFGGSPDVPTISARPCGDSVGGGESGWATPDTVDDEHRLVERLGLGQRRRHRRALRSSGPKLAQNVEVWPTVHDRRGRPTV